MGRILLALALLFSSFSATADWQYSENIDPMTDADTSHASIVKGRNELLVVRCDGPSSYEIFVGVGKFIGTSDNYEVAYRLDKEPAVDAGKWDASTKGTALFAPAQIKGDLLEGLKTASQITIQVTDYQGSKPYSIFSLSGSTAAINKLGCIKD